MFLSQREPATGRVLHRLCWFLAPWYYLQIATMASPNLIAAKADGATVDSTKKKHLYLNKRWCSMSTETSPELGAEGRRHTSS